MPMSGAEVRAALRKLDDLRYSAGNLNQALRRIVDATHRLFRVDGAGLMLVDPDQLLRNVAVSDGRVKVLEELQILHGEGPCLDAFERKDLVDSADLKTDQRWPSFSEAAVRSGLRAVLSSPIPYNRHAVGVMAVFSASARPWTPEGELALVAFTDLAALMIANTMASEEQEELVEQLQRALDARVVIEQAKGVLMQRERLTAVQAFELLRRLARSQRRRVVDVAAEVVNKRR
jgi:GAF domain-containing protein